LDKTPGKNPTTSISIDTPVDSPPSQFELGVRTVSTDILAQDLCKRNRIKRGLVSELEQENISHPPIATKINFNSPSHHHLSGQGPPSSPLRLPSSPIRLPSSPLRPPSSPLRPPNSPLSSKSVGLNLIQHQSPAPKRRTLGDITPKKDKNILPPEPIDNLSNIPQSPVRPPKKRWMKTVDQEQKQQCSRKIVLTNQSPDDENLGTMPIRWNENDTPPISFPLIRRPRPGSPVNWSVVSALVDLGQPTTPQPLNLSTSGTRRPS
jgi:hypothetical protein